MKKFFSILVSITAAFSAVAIVCYPVGDNWDDIEWVCMGTGGDTAGDNVVVYTNYVGFCTNCVAITVEQMKFYKQHMISRCDDLESQLTKLRSDFNSMINGLISDFNSYTNSMMGQYMLWGKDNNCVPSQRADSVISSSSSLSPLALFMGLTNSFISSGCYPYSLSHFSDVLSETRLGEYGSFIQNFDKNVATTRDCFTASSYYDYWWAFHDACKEFALSFDNYANNIIHSVYRNSGDVDTDITLLYRTNLAFKSFIGSLPEEECDAAGQILLANGSHIGSEQVEGLADVMEHIDGDCHELISRVHNIEWGITNQLAELSKLKNAFLSYTNTINNVFYGSTGIELSGYANEEMGGWTNLYLTGNNSLLTPGRRYDGSNVLDRIELLLWSFTSLNSSSTNEFDRMSVSNEFRYAADQMDYLTNEYYEVVIGSVSNSFKRIRQSIDHLQDVVFSSDDVGTTFFDGFSYTVGGKSYTVPIIEFHDTKYGDYSNFIKMCHHLMHAVWYICGAVFFFLFWWAVFKAVVSVFKYVFDFFTKILSQ